MLRLHLQIFFVIKTAWIHPRASPFVKNILVIILHRKINSKGFLLPMGGEYSMFGCVVGTIHKSSANGMSLRTSPQIGVAIPLIEGSLRGAQRRGNLTAQCLLLHDIPIASTRRFPRRAYALLGMTWYWNDRAICGPSGTTVPTYTKIRLVSS